MSISKDAFWQPPDYERFSRHLTFSHQALQVIMALRGALTTIPTEDIAVMQPNDPLVTVLIINTKRASQKIAGSFLFIYLAFLWLVFAYFFL